MSQAEAIVISVEGEYKRQTNVSTYLRKLNIPFKFYIAKKEKLRRLEGCFKSHLNVIADAYAQNLDYILIFEDDMVPTKYYDQSIFDHCMNFCKTNQDWDILLLGWCFPGHIKHMKSCIQLQKISSYIYKGKCFCAHAYAISRKGMQNILQKIPSFKPETKGYDVELVEKINDIFICKPAIFDQEWCAHTSSRLYHRDWRCYLDNFKLAYFLQKYHISAVICIITFISILALFFYYN